MFKLRSLYCPCIKHYRWNQSMMVAQPVWGFENLEITASFFFSSAFTWILKLIELASQTFKIQESIDSCCVCSIMLHLPGGAERFEIGSRRGRKKEERVHWRMCWIGSCSCFGHCGLVLPKLLHLFGYQVSFSDNIKHWFLWPWEFFVVPGLSFFYNINIIFYLLYKAFVRIALSVMDSVFSAPVT